MSRKGHRAPVPHPFDCELALVPLTRGRCAVISAVDVPLVERYSWHLHAHGYAARKVHFTADDGTRRQGLSYLHREIAVAAGLNPGALDVDHINRIKTDCRRSNLRVADSYGSARNTGMRSDNTSGFRGVKRHRNKWAAKVAGRYLGSFATKEEAHSVAVAERLRLFGEFAPDYDRLQ